MSSFLLLVEQIKVKVVGGARQHLHFLCGDKENEAKENSGAALGINVRMKSVVLMNFYGRGPALLWAGLPEVLT